jgi:hypothetical protein
MIKICEAEEDLDATMTRQLGPFYDCHNSFWPNPNAIRRNDELDETNLLHVNLSFQPF